MTVQTKPEPSSRGMVIPPWGCGDGLPRACGLAFPARSSDRDRRKDHLRPDLLHHVPGYHVRGSAVRRWGGLPESIS
jgi:hypothetical protein